MTEGEQDQTQWPQWRKDLEQNGYAVVPHAIPAEACAAFRGAALDWLEHWDLGFKRDDHKTWKKEMMPDHHFGGMYRYHGVSHEDFMWKIRLQPGIKEVFAQIWGTEDLVVSFDGLNLTFPLNSQTGRVDLEPSKPWPHIDQNPRRINDLELVQGLANMAPNGPDDGGLVVVKGSHKLHQEHFDSIGGFRDQGHWPDYNGYSFDDEKGNLEDLDWYLNKGCEIVKVCGGEGSLILWDSRTIHWNCLPTGQQTRFVQYVTYAPRSWMSDQDVEKKVEVFRARVGTGCQGFQNPPIPEENAARADITRPLVEPAETPELLRSLGVTMGT